MTVSFNQSNSAPNSTGGRPLTNPTPTVTPEVLPTPTVTRPTMAGPSPVQQPSPFSPVPMQPALPALPQEVPDERMPSRYREEFSPEKPKKRGMGCFRFLFNCRCLGLSILFLLIAIIVGTVWVFTQKPANIYNPLKEWLNAGLTVLTYEPMNLEQALDGLEAQMEDFKVGENKLIISESQMYLMLKDNFSDTVLRNAYLDLKPGVVKLYRDIDNNQSAPLWLVLELSVDNKGGTTISKLGTERIGLPGFVNQVLQQVLLSVFKLTNNQNSEAGLIAVMLPLPENVKIKSIAILEDRLEVTMDVSTGLENIFGN